MEVKAQPKLFSTKTGEAIDAPPDQIAALVASGEAAFKRGEVIPVLGPNGEAASIPAEEFSRAISEGYQYEGLDSQKQRGLKEEFGDSPVRAGLEGAARGLTLGLSDVALRAAGADPEGLAARKEFNPIAATGAEVVGAVAPIFLSGGTGALAKGAAMTPAALAAKAGTGVAKGVQSVVGTGAAGLGSRIAQAAVPMAAGSAVEGALYSAGSTISEAALGNPEVNAEKFLANVGMGAALGAGIGALVGAPFGAFSRGKVPHAVSELDGTVSSVEQATNLAANSPILDEAQREGFFAAMAKQSNDAPMIKEAAAEFGLPVFPEMVASSGAVKKTSTLLDNSVSPAAIARNNMKDDAIRKVSQEVQTTLGQGIEMTENQAGNAMKAAIKNEFDAAYEPSQRLYKLTSENLPFIEVTDPAKKSIIANIRKLEEFNLEGGGLVNRVGTYVIKNLPNMKTAKDVQGLSNSLKGFVNMMEPEQRRVAGIFKEKLDDLVESATIRAGERLVKEAGDQALAAQVQQVLEAIPAAKSSYAVFRKKLDTFAKELGRSKISGKAAFDEFVDDLAPAKLLDRMFDKKDERFLQFLTKEFPELSENLIAFKKTEILKKAEKSGSVKNIFKQISDFSPEVQGVLFKPLELRRLKLAEKYLDNISYSRNPSFGNTSGTAYVAAAGQAMESPQASLKNWVRDIAIEKFIKTASVDGVDSRIVGTLKAIEESSQKITKNIGYAVRGFLDKAAPAATYGAVKSFETQEKKEDLGKFYNRQSKAVIDAASNPEALAEKTSAAFANMGEFAPKIAEAASGKAAMGAMFLYEKMPKNPFQGQAFMGTKKWKPSDMEISKWKKYVDTVEDPMRSLKDLRAGKFTMEQSETLKTVYPELFQEVVQNLMEELPKLKEELPYQKRLQLGILFNIPADPSTQPAFIQQMQAMHQASAQAEAQGGAMGGGKISKPAVGKMDKSEMAMTQTERLMTRA